MAETATDPGAEQAIQEVNRRFIDAVERGDAAGLAALYTSDSVLLPAGAPMVRGPGEIEQAFRGMMGMGVERIELRTEELSVQGDTAYEVGTATVTVRPPGQEPIQDPGKYVVIWKRQGGNWRLHVDIFNSDTPPPQQGRVHR